MTSLSVDAMNGEADCYGLKAKDLQENIRITDGVISGTLKYIEGFSGFSSKPAQQSGNYLALSFASENAEKIETKVNNGDSGSYTDLTNDKFCVYRIKNPITQSIEVRLTNDGDVSRKTYGLQGLVLKKPTVGEAAFRGDKTDYGKYGNTENFYGDGFTVKWKGTKATVTGTLKHATSNGTEGNFYAFALIDEYTGKEITVTNTKVKTEKETDWVCSISEQIKSGGITVKYGNTLIAEFDFNGVELAEA